MKSADTIEAALAELSFDGETDAALTEEAARIGFLRWVIDLPEEASAVEAARVALNRRGHACAASAAARLFVRYLEETAIANSATPRPSPTRYRLH